VALRSKSAERLAADLSGSITTKEQATLTKLFESLNRQLTEIEQFMKPESLLLKKLSPDELQGKAVAVTERRSTRGK